MMSTMTSRSDIIRAGATPEFINLVETLYGGLIDPEEIWQDVAKAGPDQADLNAHGKQGQVDGKRMFLRGAAITGGVVGGALGVREGVQGVNEFKAARTAGNAIQFGTKKKLAISGTLGVTDSLDLGVLATEKTKRYGDESNSHFTRNGQLRRTGGVQGTKAAADFGGLFPAMKDLVAGAKTKSSEIAGKFHPTGGTVAPKPVGQNALPGLDTVSTPNAPGKIRQKADKIAASAKTAFGTQPGRQAAAWGAGAATVAAGAGNKINNKVKSYNDPYSGMYKSADSEVEWSGTFSKFDTDKHLAFGWASVSKVNGLPVIDKQGDYIDPDDLESAAYEYVLKSRVGGTMHKRDENDLPVKVADIVESMVFTDDKVAKMGLPDNFNRGWWVGMKIHDDDTWEEVKKGGRTGFSIHGKGIRKDQDVDALMSYS